MRTVVFDVNETLLDLAPVRSFFLDAFDGEVTAEAWFSELLRLSFVSSTIDAYRPFTELAGHALSSVTGGTASPADREVIGDLLRSLPPHTDVTSGLEALASLDVTVAALTNSPMATARAQLDHAGIAHWFDRILSVDMVQRFKPHRSVYEAACRELDTSPADTTIVAAHDWDIAGAMAAGLNGIFVARPGQTWSPAFSEPNAVVPDIPAAAAWVARELGR